MSPASILALDGAAPLCHTRCPPTPSAAPLPPPCCIPPPATPSLLTSSQRTAAQCFPVYSTHCWTPYSNHRRYTCTLLLLSFSSTRVPRCDAISNSPASSTSTASLGRALIRWLRAHMCSLVGGHSHVHSTVPKGTVRVLCACEAQGQIYYLLYPISPPL